MRDLPAFILATWRDGAAVLLAFPALLIGAMLLEIFA